MREQLINAIKKGFTSLNECYQIGEGHKQSYVERVLRQICELPEFEPVKNPKGHIVGYVKVNPTTDTNARAPYTEKKERKILNEELAEILKRTPVGWDNYNDIKAIKDAMKSNSEVLKKGVINKYK